MEQLNSPTDLSHITDEDELYRRILEHSASGKPYIYSPTGAKPTPQPASTSATTENMNLKPAKSSTSSSSLFGDSADDEPRLRRSHTMPTHLRDYDTVQVLT
jgi:hypothetical protein